MKKIVLLTAAAIATAAAFGGAASAQPYNTGDFARAALERLVPNTGAASLSNSEAVAVYQAVQDEDGVGNQKARAEAMIRSYQ
ncbi:hypothetical protein M4578_25015 [Salipiger sp. P9]|uniref:hypothetical protein n=1 Tax=Salipiger pentaromativorans TaxID=2943193 RepID=UPI00215727D4|nr:hypothetical protein [Salipiger pentaromativorans]MCR8551092.1 hypothetical protein [Salipiger pentaromativorans]